MKTVKERKQKMKKKSKMKKEENENKGGKINKIIKKKSNNGENVVLQLRLERKQKKETMKN